MLGPAPIDMSEPEATRLRKAGEGALWYGLRRAGWTDEQIHNSLLTHHSGILEEAADAVADPGGDPFAGWESAREVLRNLATDARARRTY